MSPTSLFHSFFFFLSFFPLSFFQPFFLSHVCLSVCSSSCFLCFVFFCFLFFVFFLLSSFFPAFLLVGRQGYLFSTLVYGDDAGRKIILRYFSSEIVYSWKCAFSKRWQICFSRFRYVKDNRSCPIATACHIRVVTLSAVMCLLAVMHYMHICWVFCLFVCFLFLFVLFVLVFGFVCFLFLFFCSFHSKYRTTRVLKMQTVVSIPCLLWPV